MFYTCQQTKYHNKENDFESIKIIANIAKIK